MLIQFETALAKDLEEIISLRHRVLHPGGPIDRVQYKEDSLPSTLHLILKREECIRACGTLIDEGDGVFRIRGMAIEESLRGQGIGSSLIEDFLIHVQKNKAKLIWCNGRVAALSLYERKGFKREGAVFDVPGSGPHYRLEQSLCS